MANINLSTGGAASNRGGLPYKKGILVIFAIVIILGGIYAGIIFYQKILTARIQSLNDLYTVEHAKLTGESNKKILDFQNRLNAAKELSVRKSTAVEAFAEMEKNIANGAYIASYDLDVVKNSLEISCVADNFNLVSQQVMLFKNSDFFSGVELGDAKANEDGKVEFKIKLKIK